MDDWLTVGCLLFVGLLNVVGILIVFWLVKREKGLRLSQSGLEAKDEITAEKLLLFAELKKEWETKPPNQTIPQFIQEKGITLGFKYPRASVSLFRDTKSLLRELGKLGIDF